MSEEKEKSLKNLVDENLLNDWKTRVFRELFKVDSNNRR